MIPSPRIWQFLTILPLGLTVPTTLPRCLATQNVVLSPKAGARFQHPGGPHPLSPNSKERLYQQG